MNVEKHLIAEVSEIAFTILCCVICFVEQRKKIKTTTTDCEPALAAAQATSIFVSHRGRNYFRCVSSLPIFHSHHKYTYNPRKFSTARFSLCCRCLQRNGFKRENGYFHIKSASKQNVTCICLSSLC